MVTIVINDPGYFDTEHTTGVLPVTPSANLCGQLTISRLQTLLTAVVRNASKRRHLPLRLLHLVRCNCSSFHIDHCLFDSVQQSAKATVRDHHCTTALDSLVDYCSYRQNTDWTLHSCIAEIIRTLTQPHAL